MEDRQFCEDLRWIMHELDSENRLRIVVEALAQKKFDLLKNICEPFQEAKEISWLSAKPKDKKLWNTKAGIACVVLEAFSQMVETKHPLGCDLETVKFVYENYPFDINYGIFCRVLIHCGTDAAEYLRTVSTYSFRKEGWGSLYGWVLEDSDEADIVDILNYIYHVLEIKPNLKDFGYFIRLYNTKRPREITLWFMKHSDTIRKEAGNGKYLCDAVEMMEYWGSKRSRNIDVSPAISYARMKSVKMILQAMLDTGVHPSRRMRGKIQNVISCHNDSQAIEEAAILLESYGIKGGEPGEPEELKEEEKEDKTKDVTESGEDKKRRGRKRKQPTPTTENPPF